LQVAPAAVRQVGGLAQSWACVQLPATHAPAEQTVPPVQEVALQTHAVPSHAGV
jgi:hypothetical protein